MQKKTKSTQERPMPKVEAKEPFTTASAHTAVRNGFCIRLCQPWDAKVPKYTAKNGTAWCRWAWLGLAGRAAEAVIEALHGNKPTAFTLDTKPPKLYSALQSSSTILSSRPGANQSTTKR